MGTYMCISTYSKRYFSHPRPPFIDAVVVMKVEVKEDGQPGMQRPRPVASPLCCRVPNLDRSAEIMVARSVAADRWS